MTATAEPTTALKEGRVVAIFGPVVDVEFPPDALPEINTALEMDIELEGDKITVTAEVAQQIGEGRCRAVCLKPTDGLQRGTAVRNLGHGRTSILHQPQRCYAIAFGAKPVDRPHFVCGGDLHLKPSYPRSLPSAATAKAAPSRSGNPQPQSYRRKPDCSAWAHPDA